MIYVFGVLVEFNQESRELYVPPHILTSLQIAFSQDRLWAETYIKPYTGPGTVKLVVVI